jgi:hypothetical protein
VTVPEPDATVHPVHIGGVLPVAVAGCHASGQISACAHAGGRRSPSWIDARPPKATAGPRHTSRTPDVRLWTPDSRPRHRQPATTRLHARQDFKSGSRPPGSANRPISDEYAVICFVRRPAELRVRRPGPSCPWDWTAVDATNSKWVPPLGIQPRVPAEPVAALCMSTHLDSAVSIR